jgi:hypothetical protein
MVYRDVLEGKHCRAAVTGALSMTPMLTYIRTAPLATPVFCTRAYSFTYDLWLLSPM